MALKNAFSKTRKSLEGKYANFRHSPDVIVIGEIHTDEKHTRNEARLIERFRPEYVLCEGLDQETPETTKNFVNDLKYGTVAKLAEVAGMKPEDMGITPDIIAAMKSKNATDIRELAERYQKELGYGKGKAMRIARKGLGSEGKTPKEYKSLVRTPIHELGANAINAIENSIGKKQDEYVKRGDIKSNEVLTTVIRFLTKYSSFYGDSMKKIRTIGYSAAQVGAKLAGCDIEKEIPKTDLGDGKDPMQYMENFASMVDKLNQYATSKNPEREREMGNKIVGYAKQRKTDCPIIVIIGDYHARKDSGVYEALKEAGLKYKTVRQRSGGGDALKQFFYMDRLGSK
ncbi:MAG: hypothetical protein V1836_02500 [Candidatus Aenigmatarchaeota archaeon]